MGNIGMSVYTGTLLPLVLLPDSLAAAGVSPAL